MILHKKLFVFFTLIILNNNTVFAINEQFLLDLNFNYSVNKEGEVIVDKKIGIINLENELSVTSFTQNLEEYNYYDLKAKDSQGFVEYKEIDEENTKRIVIPLRGTKIGKNQVNNLEISYKSKDLIKKIGSIYFFNLPKIPKNNVKNLSISISVPKDYGKLIFISPTNFSLEERENENIYRFKDNASLDQAISASFGEYQVINFNIKYELENTSNWFANKEIALIPDVLKYQEIAYKELSPKPTEITIDEDGNYLAKYRLNPKSKLDIMFKGSVRIYGNQIDINKGGEFSEIPEEIIKKYTESQKYWETKSSEIVDISATLKDEKLSVTKNAQKIYKFLTENYDYNFEITKENQVERHGALKAVRREVQLGCMEFTDSFIAIARSMGIPSREINGYAFSDDPTKKPINIDLNSLDKLHSWAEFYDPNLGWVQIDPTWGATSEIDYFSKLDLNHITFVKKGIDSEYPIPAGMYKLNQENKQIEVDFPINTTILDFEKKFTASNNFSFNVLNLISNQEPIKIVNNGYSTIFLKNNERVLPFSESIVYMNKKEERVFYDFNFSEYELYIKNSVFYYVLIIIYISFVGLLLYVILYLLVTHSKNLQKLFARPFRHPRDQDR
jgi:transglutaminase-like putative cysteine protease